MLSHKDLSRITESIEEWYKENGRTFPWRKRTISPFEVLMAEILLWKTRAETIRGFFLNFAKRYNNPEKLAKTRWQELAKELEPLGLHERRAKLLVKLGKALSGRSVPKTQEELEGLPGVGQYIARAVLCFGHGLPFIPVDVNVQRVIKRVFDLRIHNLRKLKEEEEELLSSLALISRDCKKLSWGLIDLAATVCKPKVPSCDLCPIEEFCAWRKSAQKIEGKQGR